MMLRPVCMLVLMFVGTVVETANPCGTNHTLVPNLSTRITSEQVIQENDNYLTEGYYSGGNDFDMTTSMSAGITACGSLTQCWMNALQNTSTDPAPNFIPSNVHIVPQLTPIQESNFYSYILKFLCDFTEGNELFYTIIFYVNNEFVSDHVKTVDTASDAFLLESDLPVDANTAGITVSCKVGAMHTSDGRIGTMTKSAEFFAGLEVVNDKHVSLARGGSHIVRVRPTVPIGCKTETTSDDISCEVVCFLVNEEKSFSSLKCDQVGIRNHNKCSLKMQGGTDGQSRNKEYEFSISTLEAEITSYNLEERNFHFQLSMSSDMHDFWNGRSEAVTVTVYDNTDIWKGKSCSIYCDPHMRTFDSQPYELQIPGVFIAFQHSTLPIQVQVKSALCKGTPWPNAYCMCGIAVIVGKAYHIINTCKDQEGKRIKNVCGEHDVLQVIATGTDFEFRVPTGLKIVATRREKTFWDITLYPTVLEVDHTSGLCGSLDGNICNDFTHMDGSMPVSACGKPWNYHPNAFTESFKLAEEKHMFQDDYEVDSLVDDFLEYPASLQVCYCHKNIEEATIPPGSGGTVRESTCGFRQYASCTKNENSCKKRYLSIARRRRSAVGKQIVDNQIPDSSHLHIRKRRTVTEEEARTFCEAQMSENPLRSQCAEMNLDTSDTEIDNCILDILATGDTEWASIARDRASQVCLTEVKKNLSAIQESFPESAALVQNLTCPNNCSNQGICSNGECSCNSGFAAEDCSVALTVTPNVDDLGLGTHPICDVSEDCVELFVNGGDFPSNRSYTCRYSVYHVNNNGTRSFAGYSEISGRQRNIFQVTCPLTYADRLVDTFVLEYELFLKMDDNSFSSGLPFIILDSTCQGFSELTGKYSYYQEPGYCFINGTCYVEGAEKTNDTCHRCVSSSNPYAWTIARDVDECATTVESDADSASHGGADVTAIVIMTVLAIICVAAVIAGLVAKLRWGLTNTTNNDTSGTLLSQRSLSNEAWSETKS